MEMNIHLSTKQIAEIMVLILNLFKTLEEWAPEEIYKRITLLKKVKHGTTLQVLMTVLLKKYMLMVC